VELILKSEIKRMPPLLAYFFLFLVYISTFRLFATLPFDFLHTAISTSAIVLFSIYYLLDIAVHLRSYRITKIDLLMWLFIFINIFSAYIGHKEFGQPIYYGILAQSSILLSLSGILLISFLNKGLITIRQVERSFVIISLTILFTCYFFILFVDPSHFTDQDFVSYSSIRGYRYRFQFALVVMLLFYSLFKISRERKPGYAVIVALVLFYMIYFLQSRTSLIVLCITLLIYFYRNFSLRKKIRKIFYYGSMILIGGTISIMLGFTSLLEKYKLLYNNALDAFTNESPVEPSSAVRFKEYQLALEYIGKNPFFGNGFISNQWRGGYRDLFGYFYPVDIGLLGNIFVYGIIGTIVIYIPYYFSLRMSRKIFTGNIFIKTCQYMLLFFFLSMFFSAVNIRDSASIMFLVCLIYYFRYYDMGDYQLENLNPETV
jgi:hypothetical protein